MRRQLHVVTAVGLPLAGKSSLVTQAARLLGVETFERHVGHRGFCGTQIACLLNLESLGHPNRSLLLRTFRKAVWTPAFWDLSMAESDALLLVLDAQESRDTDQASFLTGLSEAIRCLFFAATDAPLAAVITKADLVSERELEIARGSIAHLRCPINIASGRTGEGVLTALQGLLDEIGTRPTGPDSLDGDVAMALYEWSPLKPERSS